MAYIETSDLKLWIGATEGTDDALLLWCVTAAAAIIESEAGTGRIWEVAADTTRTFDPTRDVDGAVLYLDHDLCQVTSITNGDGVALSASDYVLEGVAGKRNTSIYRQVRIKSTSTRSWTYTTAYENSISIVGRWGASVTPPTRIKQLAREIAAYLYRSRAAASDAASDRPLLTGDGVTVLARRLPGDVLARMRVERRVT